MLQGVYDPDVHSQDWVRRNRVRQWMEANGVDTRLVSVDCAIYVDPEKGEINYTGFETDEDGRISWSEQFQGPLLDTMTAPVKFGWIEKSEEGDDA